MGEDVWGKRITGHQTEGDVALDLTKEGNEGQKKLHKILEEDMKRPDFFDFGGRASGWQTLKNKINAYFTADDKMKPWVDTYKGKCDAVIKGSGLTAAQLSDIIVAYDPAIVEVGFLEDIAIERFWTFQFIQNQRAIEASILKDIQAKGGDVGKCNEAFAKFDAAFGGETKMKEE